MTNGTPNPAKEPSRLNANVDDPVEVDPVTRIGNGGGVNVPEGIQPPETQRQ
jgi:hypothetical protein